MAGDSILAIDQGTTSTRAMIFDRNARAIAVAQQELPQIYPADGSSMIRRKSGARRWPYAAKRWPRFPM